MAAAQQTRNANSFSLSKTLKANKKLHQYFWRTIKNFRDRVFFMNGWKSKVQKL